VKLKLKEEPREWQKFVLTTIPAPALLSLWLWWRRVLPAGALVAVLASLALILVVCLLRPAWFRGFYRRGMGLGFQAAHVVGSGLLMLCFLLVVTPLGLALRLAGKDLLRLRRDPAARSYWRDAKTTSRLEDMF